MPIYVKSARSAFDSARRHPSRHWSQAPLPGNVYDETREGQGGFKAFSAFADIIPENPVRLTRADRIFTIGSCFARNVEDALEISGFEVLSRNPEVYPYSPGYLNRYNTPSMVRELELAKAGAQAYAGDSVIRHGEGFSDLTAYGLFSTRAEALDHRVKAIKLFEGIRRATAVFITCGLSEVWYDRKLDAYLNVAPSRAFDDEPDRYEFRVLSYQDNVDGLRSLVESVRGLANPGVKIVLTVSPVPLNATFLDRDVLISNTYSKAVLRAAIEQIVAEDSSISYFPSYELVALSDPGLVWHSDRRHVRQEFVNQIVIHFIRHYCA